MLKRILIPSLGDVLKLASDWTFQLHVEGRNASLLSLMEGRKLRPYSIPCQRRWDHTKNEFVPAEGWQMDYPKPFTILAKSRLRVERIFIRAGAAEFDSLTFRVVESSEERLKGCRFWAKLEDVNGLEIEC